MICMICMICMIWLMLAGESRILCMTQHKFTGLELCCTDPAQHLTSAG